MNQPTHSVLLLAILVLLSALLAACAGGGSEDGVVSREATPVAQPSATIADPAAGAGPTAARTSYPLTVRSDDGRPVTLDRAPSRILSLSPGVTEILFAIGAGEMVAGVDRFSNFPAAVGALPKIDFSNPNIESLVALRPDLVVATTRQRNLVPGFEQAGLRVLLLEEPESVAVVLERVRLHGRITDRAAKAEEVAAAMEVRIAAVTGRLTGVQQGPRVYHELDPALFSAAPNSFVGDLYTRLKAQNVAQGGGTPYPKLTAEAILAADPEVIILTDAEFPGGSVEEVKRRPGWSALSAVRGNRVHGADGDLLSRPGPRLVEGLELLAKLLYPQVFR